MKKLLILITGLSLIVAATGYASPHRGHAGAGSDRYFSDLVAEELEGFASESATVSIGDLSVAELTELLGTLSVREQEAAYVRSLRLSSFIAPGFGQFRGGDTLGGSLFLLGDIGLSVGTVWSAYALLPESVQIRTDGGAGINYWSDSKDDIDATWGALSFADLAPSLGVVLGGSILDLVWRTWSASDARDLAHENLESGAVVFEPQPFTFVGDRMGLGMRMRY
ncbi:MAG: hypothetical protein ACLFNQ_07440 [Spirochaetaceae bacterium]